MASKQIKTKQSKTNQNSDGMRLITPGMFVPTAGYLTMCGLEYVALFLEEERDKVMESLGFFPLFGDLRQYIRTSDRRLLSAESCSVLFLHDVEGEFLSVATADIAPHSLLTFWRDIFFLPEEEMTHHELALMNMSLGDKASVPTHVLVRLMDRRFPVSSTTCEFVQGTVGGDIHENVTADVMEEFVRHVEVATGVDFDSRDHDTLDSVVDVQREQGYCYLELFPFSMAGAVAASLGPNPLARDVAMVLLSGRYVLDNFDTDRRYKLSRNGEVLHVSEGTDTMEALVLDMIRLSEHDPTCVVGAVMLSNHVKGPCDVCGFTVRLEGHSERCKPVSDDHARSEFLRKASWLGDARHHMDVREILLSAGIPAVRLETESQKYTAAEPQAKWYNSYMGEKEVALGTSSRAKATAFEASYRDRFRRVYVQWLLNIYGHRQIERDLVSHYRDDRCLDVVVDDSVYLESLHCSDATDTSATNSVAVILESMSFDAPAAHRTFPKKQPAMDVFVIDGTLDVIDQRHVVSGDHEFNFSNELALNDFTFDNWHVLRLPQAARLTIGDYATRVTEEIGLLYIRGRADVSIVTDAGALQTLVMTTDVSIKRLCSWKSTSRVYARDETVAWCA